MQNHQVAKFWCLATLAFSSVVNQRAMYAEELSFPTAGVSYNLPDGIVVSLKGGPNQLALLTPKNESPQQAKYLIVLELTPCNRKDLRGYCEGIAARLNGKILESSLAGEVAFEVNAIANAEKRGPNRVRIVEKSGYFFSVFLQSSSRNEGLTEFNAICSGMSWMERGVPSDHLQLEDSHDLFSRSLRMRLPRVLRSYPVQDASLEAAFSAFNYRDFGNEFFLQARIVNAESGKELSQIASDLGKNVSSKFNTPEDLQWRMMNPEGTVIASMLFDAEIQVPGVPRESQKLRYAIVRFPTNQFVLIQFGISNASEAAVVSYANCIEAMINAIEISATK